MMVIDVRRMLTRLMFVGQVSICAWVYLFGAHGFSYLRSLKTSCQETECALVRKESEIARLQQEIIDWNVHSFYKEKMAREQLQMARKGEVVYLLDRE